MFRNFFSSLLHRVLFYYLLYFDLLFLSGTMEQIGINVDMSVFMSCSTFEFSGTKLEQLEHYSLTKHHCALWSSCLKVL